MILPDDVAIQATGLSKKYRLFDSPRQRLKDALDPWGRTFHEDFWALRDIDLTVHKGHTVGILGRNGSGKSTLLQLITSVLQPTSGSVEVAGRIAALLELGAGFDPDFTGRDNVRQYGLLQGLKTAEIEDRLPAIEEFARIGEFFDHPVRTYSSGMFARLAFAAAINAEPDILIIDEILAVGDARFQQRCLRRIQEMTASGCSVLFVSHSTEQVLRLCDQALLLEAGRSVLCGPTSKVVDAYHQILYGSGTPAATSLPSNSTLETEQERKGLPKYIEEFLTAEDFSLARKSYYNPNESQIGSRQAKIVDILAIANGEPLTGPLEGKEQLTLWLKIQYKEHVESPRIGWGIVTPEGIMVSGSNSVSRGIRLPDASANEIVVYRVDIQLNLCGGEYFFNLGVSTYDPPEWQFIDTRRAVVHFSVRNNQTASGLVDFFSTCDYCASTKPLMT